MNTIADRVTLAKDVSVFFRFILLIRARVSVCVRTCLTPALEHWINLTESNIVLTKQVLAPHLLSSFYPMWLHIVRFLWMYVAFSGR